MKKTIIALSLAIPLLQSAVAQVAAPEKVKGSQSTIATERTDKWGPGWKKRHNHIVKQANIDTEKRQLVFVGDSITQSWGGGGKNVWAKNFAKFNALNSGISGERTEHTLWRLRNGAWPKNLKPKVAVVMIGTNNTGAGKGQPPMETAAGIKLIVEEIHKRSPQTKIILHAIFPRGATPQDGKRLMNDKINATISKLGKHKSVTYLDLADKFLDKNGNLPKEVMPDRLHPNAKGYQIWADNITPVINKLMKDPLTSVGGFKAKFIKLEGEGEGKTEIWKDGKKVAEIASAGPVSFSPVADILLLREYGADDDLKQYLLNIGKGEYAMQGSRLKYVFGSRYMTSSAWSADGTKLTLTNATDMTDKPTEVFKVNDLLKR